MPAHSFRLTYKNQTWKLDIEKVTGCESQIGVFLAVDGEWARYGVVQLHKDPHSCTVAMERNMMPYAVMRTLFQIVEKEAVRLNIRFDMTMTSV